MKGQTVVIILAAIAILVFAYLFFFNKKGNKTFDTDLQNTKDIDDAHKANENTTCIGLAANGISPYNNKTLFVGTVCDLDWLTKNRGWKSAMNEKLLQQLELVGNNV